MKKYFGLLFIVLLIAGCGGGGGGTSSSNNTTTTKYTVTFNVDNNGGGYISGSPSQTVDANASTTAVTAFPLAGYTFLNWTDATGVVGTNPTLTLTGVSANRTLTAHFQAPPAGSFAVNYAATTGGTLTVDGTNFVPNTSQTVVSNSNTTAVTAVANPGFAFVNWTNDQNQMVTTNATVTLTGVTASTNLTANFAPQGYLSAAVTDSASGMTASFPTTNAIVDDGHGLNSTVESFDVTVAVANIPSGATYQVKVAASDASGNIIPLYNNLPDLSSTTNYLVINGSGATAAATASLPAGATGAGYLLPVGTGTGHWTIISITRTN